jgi:hypothetical protein
MLSWYLCLSVSTRNVCDTAKGVVCVANDLIGTKLAIQLPQRCLAVRYARLYYVTITGHIYNIKDKFKIV